MTLASAMVALTWISVGWMFGAIWAEWRQYQRDMARIQAGYEEKLRAIHGNAVRREFKVIDGGKS